MYNVSTGTWNYTGSLNIVRYSYGIVSLPSGKILVAGGLTGSPTPPQSSITTATEELYDPATGIWTRTGSMTIPRETFSMVLLCDGTVLAAGGGTPGAYLATAELYDPATGMWTPTGSLNVARYGFQMVLLPNGTVLAACGYSYGAYWPTAELYNPATGLWNYTGSTQHGALPVSNGAASQQQCLGGRRFRTQCFERCGATTRRRACGPLPAPSMQPANYSKCSHFPTVMSWRPAD